MHRPLLSLLLLLGVIVAAPAPAAEAGEPQDIELQVESVVGDLDHPWGLDFTPFGTMVFTERPGFIWAMKPGDESPQPVTFNKSDLFVQGETGLLDLVIDPDFNSNRRVFTCQGHQAGSAPPQVQVISWRLNAALTQMRRLRDPLVANITRYGQPGRHGGCRLLFDGAGNLWIGTGDGAFSANPQGLRRLGGKVLRVDPDTGQGVPGNPWFDRANPNKRRIWNYGHRNIQGLALRPGTTAAVWTVEHGSNVDDEINQAIKGKNFGWSPGPGYNENVPMTDLDRFPGAVEARWSSGSPTIATSGAVFLEGAQWGPWEGALAVACLKDMSMRIFPLQGGQLDDPADPPELRELNKRLRTAVMGPDNALYVTTSSGNNADVILRVTPASS